MDRPQQLLAPLDQRPLQQHVVAEGEEVEGDVRRRRLGGQAADAGLGRVDALEEGVEVEAPTLAVGDDDLAVDDAACRERSTERLESSGK